MNNENIFDNLYSGEWHVFSGNELGALLGWWMIHIYQVLHPDVDMSKTYMLASTVSSKILASMAKKEGFNFEVCMFNIYIYMQQKSCKIHKISFKSNKNILLFYRKL